MEYCSNTGAINTICNTTNGVSYAGALIGYLNSSVAVYSCWSSADVVQDATAIPAQAKKIYSGLYAGKNTNYSANFVKCYYNSDKLVAKSSVSTGKTTAQFASGEVTYLLGEPWGQNITVKPKELYPVLGGMKVVLDGTTYCNVSIADLAKLIAQMNAGNATKADVENMVNKLLDK